MVVRFPSESEPGEHLAPVTPLRRAGASPKQEPAETEAGDSTAGTRPVADIWAITGQTKEYLHPGWNELRAEQAEDDGDEVLRAEIERQSKKAATLTIRQLARRGMSRWELEELLVRKEIDPVVYAGELDRLEALGLIDDASLAASVAFTQHSRKGLGRSAIEQELKRRHIAPELIEAALADIGDEDEQARATELALKRIGQLSSYDDETARRRLHGFLARKGYSSSVVRHAMDEAFATRRTRGVRFQ